MNESTLLLNSSRTFLSVIDYKKAICGVYLDKLIVLENYDRTVSSPSTTMQVPAVVCLKDYVYIAYEKLFRVTYSSTNVHIRDKYTCQYCEESLKGAKKKTIDHVHPVSKGGLSTWDNTVACCVFCNKFKADKLLSDKFINPATGKTMALIREPKRPTDFSTVMKIKFKQIHDLWEKYLKFEE